MSFGWSAAVWTAIGVGVSTAVAVDSQDSARKAAHTQQDAVNAAKAADAAQAAKAEVGANAAAADAKRRRRAANGLTATDPLGSSVPPATSVLGGGGMAPAGVTGRATLGGA